MNKFLSNLNIKYSWGEKSYHLKTRIEFLNNPVRNDVNIPEEYADFAEEEVRANSENYFIDLLSAEDDGLVVERAFIYCYADWPLGVFDGGPVTLSYDYNGKTYAEIVYPKPSPFDFPQNLVKIIEVKVGEVASPYSNNKIYEFEPVQYLNVNDLSQTATGFLIHKNKDVQFKFDLNDRESNALLSTSSIAESSYVNSVNIDILDIYGNIISDNYVTNSFSNNFLFTEQENINLFGKYTENFGIGVQIIGADTNIHANKYYVYANKLEIKNISVSDSRGYFLNENPISHQNYTGSNSYETNCFFENVTDSALYWEKYSLTKNLYNVNLSATIPFAILTGESLKIDWGHTGGLDTIFQQTGLIGFSGVDSVNAYPTDTGDFRFVNAIYPSIVNGQTYNFITGYDYPSGITGIYNANIYYSGAGSSGNELIKTIEYRIPDELISQGKIKNEKISNEKINFEIELLNRPSYTNLDKFEVYANTVAESDITNSFLVKTIPIFTNTNYHSFSLEKNDISVNKDYWFTILAYSSIGPGYSWTVGPYYLHEDPTPKSSITTESLNLFNGNSVANIDFITGEILNDEINTIDYIEKGIHKTHDYICQFEDASGYFCSSKVLIVDNTSCLDPNRTGLCFSQYAISDNSFINLSIDNDTTGIYFNAQLDTPIAYFKLYKTSI